MRRTTAPRRGAGTRAHAGAAAAIAATHASYLRARDESEGGPRNTSTQQANKQINKQQTKKQTNTVKE